MRALVFLTIIAVVQLSAQINAVPLLEQVQANYTAAKSYHLEYETEGELKSEMHGSWSKSREVAAKDEKGRVRHELYGLSGSHVVVSDGAILWRASPDTREFIVTPVSGPVFEVKGGGSLAEMSLRSAKGMMSYNERLMDNLNRAEQIREEPIDLAGKQINCLVVRIEYAPPKGSIGIESWTRTLWIDKERKIILQDHNVTRGKLSPSKPFEDMESTHRRRYTVAAINEPVPDALFTYTPPANYREMDKLERATPRPAKDMIGKPAPALALRTLTGEEAKLTDYKGKIVLLDFWATWCEPCRKQMPSIAKLYAETKDQGLVMLGVNDDETPEKALEFLKEHNYAWQHLFDGKEKDARSKFKIDAIPTLVLIDKQGALVDIQIGNGDTAEEAIRAALRKQGLTIR